MISRSDVKSRGLRVGGLLATLTLVGGLLTGCNLAPDVALGGVVTSPEGAGMGQVTVTVFSDSVQAQVAQTTTKFTGQYQIKQTDLGPGTYRVRAGDQWYGDGATDWSSATPVTVTAGTPKRLDITFAGDATIRGTVVDGNHDPAAGVVALAVDSNDNVLSSNTATTTGAFALGVPGDTTFTLKFLVNRHGAFATMGGANPSPLSVYPGADFDLGTLQIGVPTQVDIGQFHTCAREDNGTVSCWGNNQDGQLGDGTQGGSHTPILVPGITDATQVTLGWFHSCALHRTGTVSCWGANDAGQLGDGSTDESWTPVAVPNLDDVVQIGGGDAARTCALTADGEVYCWGNNDEGELGNGTTDPSSTPVPVSNLSDITQLAVGFMHSCALHSNGTVSCWGSGARGQLGNGSFDNSSTPVIVPNLSDITQLSAVGYHTCAVHTGGTVSCWGGNLFGALGDGTTDNSPSPVAVKNLSDVTQVAAGGYHVCALHSGGTVSCWGNNQFGQLGDGSTTNSSTPVPVSNLTDAKQLDGGVFGNCAVRTKGVVACWGSNNFGMLGNDSTTASSTPVGVLGLPYVTMPNP